MCFVAYSQQPVTRNETGSCAGVAIVERWSIKQNSILMESETCLLHGDAFCLAVTVNGGSNAIQCILTKQFEQFHKKKKNTKKLYTFKILFCFCYI